jgi:hypothetical protein
MPDDDLFAEADKVKAAAEQQYASLRASRDLRPEVIQQEIANVHLRTRDRLRELGAERQSSRDARVASAEPGSSNSRTAQQPRPAIVLPPATTTASSHALA